LKKAVWKQHYPPVISTRLDKGYQGIVLFFTRLEIGCQGAMLFSGHLY
jgi:hypothetical protein